MIQPDRNKDAIDLEAFKKKKCLIAISEGRGGIQEELMWTRK